MIMSLAWFGMVWYGLVWFGMVWYGLVWLGMIWHGGGFKMISLFIHEEISLLIHSGKFYVVQVVIQKWQLYLVSQRK